MGRRAGRDARVPDVAVTAARSPSRRRRWLWLLLVPVLLIATCLAADWWICLPDSVQPAYVGLHTCVECHAAEVEEWTGSDHDRAMELATDESVLGDFNDVQFTQHGLTSRMYRDGRRFMIHTEGPDGQMGDFEVKYTFGVRPLQQYMVEFDRPADMPDTEIARLQVLRISWDTEKRQWFDCPPPDARERLGPDDPMHWTGISQCWNNMCAYCHSTNLRKNYDVESRVYHTTYAAMDVSCEACHGPASVHVQLATKAGLFWDRKRGYGLVRLKGADTHPEIHSCAPCHSRRRVVYPDFRPGDQYYDYFDNELLEEATYYADGQIMDEDYVFGSFIQSRMYHQNIRCSDCHNPHSLRLRQEGNRVCTACHQHPAAQYDTPKHHFHKSDSTGASCAECHMPETIYMEVDARRDHSIRIPRPDLSVAWGTPNACTRCHLSDARISDDKRAGLRQYRDWLDAARAGDEEIRGELARIDQWMLESMQQWYRKDAWGESFAPALAAGRRGEAGAEQALAALSADRRQPGIARATAIQQRAQLPRLSSLQPELAALADPDPQVRRAAVARFYEQIPVVAAGQLLGRQESQAIRDHVAPIVRQLVPLLDDPLRSVRAEAGRVLARLPLQLTSELLNGSQREKLDRAIDTYIAGVLEANDRSGAHVELGILYESLGRETDALAAYRTAIRVEPGMTGPRSNLAELLERISDRRGARSPGGQPDVRDAELHAEVKLLRREELELLARDARLLPDNPSVQYRYGLSLYLNGEPERAEVALRAACRLAPANDDILHFLVMFLDMYERYDEALEAADRLVGLRPDELRYRQLRDAIAEKQRNATNR